MEVIPELKNTKSLTMDQQKEKEAELLLKAFQPGDVIVLLDEFGKEFRSVDFANWLEKKMHNVNKRLVLLLEDLTVFLKRYMMLRMKRFLCRK